jgi:NADH/F420H2 dehydrogenase subunit C
MKKNLIIIYNLKYFQKIFPIKKIQIYNSEITVVVSENSLKDLLFFLKNSILCQFNLMTCISCVDYPVNKFRFQIVYDLLSLKYNSRIRVKIFINELLQVPSCAHIFSAANWFESEIWDMFGVFFMDHPNLKRLLTDYGFEGYPLRKDFPLSGFIEMRFIENLKRVSGESIEFSQEYRTFNFMSPWQV